MHNLSAYAIIIIVKADTQTVDNTPSPLVRLDESGVFVRPDLAQLLSASEPISIDGGRNPESALGAIVASGVLDLDYDESSTKPVHLGLEHFDDIVATLDLALKTKDEVALKEFTEEDLTSARNTLLRVIPPGRKRSRESSPPAPSVEDSRHIH